MSHDPHDCYDFDYETEECANCGGEGWVADCFDECACVDPEGGCDQCMRRCYWCRPRKHASLVSQEGGE